MKRAVAIIGGGPAGLYCASLLCKEKFNVNVFEEHDEFGEPVQCTGIVTADIMDIGPLRSLIKNTTLDCLNYARICSGISSADFHFERPNLVLDRKAFDKGLAELAKKNGASLRLKHKLVAIDGDHLVFKEKEPFRFDICIGADGPLSYVRKFAGMKGNVRFWFGAQARARCKEVSRIMFYPFLDGYGWIVPEGKGIVRIGMAARRLNRERFHSFLKENLGNFKSIEYQAGIIPEYNPRLEIAKGRIYLLGDAATQVKATTGGGIIPGLKASEALACSLNGKGDYLSNLKALRRSLWLHLRIRKALDKFTDKDYNILFRYFNNPRIREVMEKHDRENPAKYLFKILFNEPRLLRYAGKAL